LRILLDECLPEILREWLRGWETKTVGELGWRGVTNGELLRSAEGQFDLLLTADRRLRSQQNLKGRRLAVVVLPSNRLKVLRGMMAGIEAAIAKVEPGKAEQYFELAWPGEW
jgi:predicted nuclease of predicted toxin-antitoxin system